MFAILMTCLTLFACGGSGPSSSNPQQEIPRGSSGLGNDNNARNPVVGFDERNEEPTNLEEDDNEEPKESIDGDQGDDLNNRTVDLDGDNEEYDVPVIEPTIGRFVSVDVDSSLSYNAPQLPTKDEIQKSLLLPMSKMSWQYIYSLIEAGKHYHEFENLNMVLAIHNIEDEEINAVLYYMVGEMYFPCFSIPMVKQHIGRGQHPRAGIPQIANDTKGYYVPLLEVINGDAKNVTQLYYTYVQQVSLFFSLDDDGQEQTFTKKTIYDDYKLGVIFHQLPAYGEEYFHTHQTFDSYGNNTDNVYAVPKGNRDISISFSATDPQTTYIVMDKLSSDRIEEYKESTLSHTENITLNMVGYAPRWTVNDLTNKDNKEFADIISRILSESLNTAILSQFSYNVEEGSLYNGNNSFNINDNIDPDLLIAPPTKYGAAQPYNYFINKLLFTFSGISEDKETIYISFKNKDGYIGGKLNLKLIYENK